MRASGTTGYRWALIGALAALAAALLIAGPAGGESTATVRVGSAEGLSGDEVTVRLEALGLPEPGLGAFTIDVAYDPSVASPVSCRKDPEGVFDTVFCKIDSGGDAIRVGGFRTSSGATGSVALAEITFRLVGQTDACGSLDPAAAEFADTGGGSIAPLDLVSGSLCIGDTSGGSAPSGATPAGAAHPEGASATSGAGTGLPPAAATSGTPGATGGSQAGGAAGTASPSADQGRTAAPATPGPAQMGAADPTSIAKAAGSGESSAAAEEADSEGWTRWAVVVVGAAVAAALAGYVVYRRLRRRTS